MRRFLLTLFILALALPCYGQQQIAKMNPYVAGAVVSTPAASCPAEDSPDITLEPEDSLGLFSVATRKYGGPTYYNATAEKQICRIGFYVNTITGDISGKNYVMKIWQLTANNDPLPANPITNGTSASVAGSTMSATAWSYFTFSGNPTLSINTIYAVTIEQDVIDESHYLASLCSATATGGTVFTSIQRWGDDKANTMNVDPGHMRIKVYYYD